MREGPTLSQLCIVPLRPLNIAIDATDEYEDCMDPAVWDFGTSARLVVILFLLSSLHSCCFGPHQQHICRPSWWCPIQSHTIFFSNPQGVIKWRSVHQHCDNDWHACGRGRVYALASCTPGARDAPPLKRG